MAYRVITNLVNQIVIAMIVHLLALQIVTLRWIHQINRELSPSYIKWAAQLASLKSAARTICASLQKSSKIEADSHLMMGQPPSKSVKTPIFVPPCSNNLILLGVKICPESEKLSKWGTLESYLWLDPIWAENLLFYARFAWQLSWHKLAAMCLVFRWNSHR